MSESAPTNSLESFDRNALIEALGQWNEDTPELLTQYIDLLREHHGDTNEGRYRVGEDLIRVYVDAGHYDEAWKTAEDMLDTADGEGDDDQYDLFLGLQKEIEAASNPNTSQTVN